MFRGNLGKSAWHIAHGKEIRDHDTKNTDDMFCYIFCRYLGKRHRDRSPSRPRLKLQGEKLERKLQSDQKIRAQTVLNGLRLHHASRFRFRERPPEGVIGLIESLTFTKIQPQPSDQELLSELPAINQLKYLGEPHECSEAEIYLHILWKQHDPGRSWLYVGQAIYLQKRIQSHEDPDYRRAHPCLHYHVWDHEADIDRLYVCNPNCSGKHPARKPTVHPQPIGDVDGLCSPDHEAH